MHNPEPYLYSYIDSCLAHIQCTEAAAVRIKILYLMQNIVLLLDLSREEGSIVFPLFICSVSTLDAHMLDNPLMCLCLSAGTAMPRPQLTVFAS